MIKIYVPLKNTMVKRCTILKKLVVQQCKCTKFFSMGLLLAVDMDAGVLLIMMMLVAIITFLVGIAYGIYLNDKISNKKTVNHFTEG